MKREDVEALRARMLRVANNVAGHGVKLADMTFSVEGDILEALCRRWLAVEDAPCAVAGQSPGRFYYAGGSAPVEHGQRVRLVPDAGQEVGK